MSLAGDWVNLQSALPEGWERAELRLTTGDAAAAGRALSLLAPAQPFRASHTVIRLDVALDGSALSPDLVTRLLRRADDARVVGRLELAGTRMAERAEAEATVSLADAWRAALANLPPDWSDLYGEVRFVSSDYIEPAAVLCAPINPRRDGTRAALRFRSARRAGYGASPEMVARCFERCDAAELRGSVEVLRVLSDTRLVATQGPTWLLSGKNV